MIKKLLCRLSILPAVLAGGVSSTAAQATDCTMGHPMARAFRSLLMPVFLFLALLWPLPGWAAPIGASIALTDVLLNYQPVASNLSAEAAPIGGLPALPLLHNGHYKNTAAGDFAVTVNLPPLDELHVWLISVDLSINGEHVLGGQDVFGPISVTGAIDEALGRLSPFLQTLVRTLGNDLLTMPQHSFGLGLLDWSYNRDPADDLTGTFAIGSTIDLPQALIGRSLIPGEFMLDFSASAFVVDVPAPAGLLILAPAVLVLVALRWGTTRRVGKVI
jgi:hypothetical protein